MARKKKEVLRELHHPPTPEHPEGRIEVQYSDGTNDFIGKDGKPIRTALSKIVSDEQLEAWRKEPKEQALKEAIALFKEQGMDVAEQRVKLEIIRFMADLQGATQPIQVQSQAIIVTINMSGNEKVEKIIATQQDR